MNQKEGLDFFPMECATDDKIRLVTAEFGLKAKAVIVELLQQIYGVHGYYCEWNREAAMLFSLRIGEGHSGVNLLNEIVLCCTRMGVFSQEQFRKNGILTSYEIQENFFNATKRRKCVKVKKAYLLVKVALFSENVTIIDETVNILNENADSFRQSRVEDINTTLFDKSPTLDEVKRYVSENAICINPDKFYSYYQMHGWKDITDWKAAVDFWALNERPEKKVSKGRQYSSTQGTKKNQFNSFNQRDISSSDISELEQRLLNRG